MVMLGQESTTEALPLPGKWSFPTSKEFLYNLTNKAPLGPPLIENNLTHDMVRQVQEFVHGPSYYQNYKSGSAGVDAYEDRGFPKYNNNGQPSTQSKNWNTGNWEENTIDHFTTISHQPPIQDDGSLVEGYKNRGQLKGRLQ